MTNEGKQVKKCVNLIEGVVLSGEFSPAVIVMALETIKYELLTMGVGFLRETNDNGD